MEKNSENSDRMNRRGFLLLDRRSANPVVSIIARAIERAIVSERPMVLMEVFRIWCRRVLKGQELGPSDVFVSKERSAERRSAVLLIRNDRRPGTVPFAH